MSLKDSEGDQYRSVRSPTTLKFDIETNQYLKTLDEEQQNKLLHEKIHQLHQEQMREIQYLTLQEQVQKTLNASKYDQDQRHLLDQITEKEHESEGEVEQSSQLIKINQNSHTLEFEMRRPLQFDQIFCVFIGMNCLGITQTIVKQIQSETNLNFSHVSLLQGIVLLALGAYREKQWLNTFGSNQEEDNLKITSHLYFICSSSLALGLVLMNMIIYILPLSFSAVLIFSFPLFQAVWGLIISKKRINQLEIFCIFIFLAGITALMRPDLILPNELLQSQQQSEHFTNQYLRSNGLLNFGTALGLTSSCLLGLYQHCSQSLRSNEIRLTELYAGCICVVISFLMFPLFGAKLNFESVAKNIIILSLLVVFSVYTFKNIQIKQNLSLDRKTRVLSTIPILLVCIWDSFQFHTKISQIDIVAIILIQLFNLISSGCSYLINMKDERDDYEDYIKSLERLHESPRKSRTPGEEQDEKGYLYVNSEDENMKESTL